MQPLHTVHIKEKKMFVISDVIGGAELFDSDADQQPFSLAEGVVKVS
jgi:hypothetical protein